jgi:hypothetical protein
MEQVQPSSPASSQVTAAPPRGLFGTKMPATVAFAVASLLFLLPLFEIKCNGTVLANNTGIGIISGQDWKPLPQTSLFGNQPDTEKEKNFKDDPNVFAMIALGAGILGLIFTLAFANIKMAGTVTGIIGLVALIGLLIDLKSKIGTQAAAHTSAADLRLDVGTKITVDGTPWFWLALIAFLFAAIFSWKQVRQVKRS